MIVFTMSSCMMVKAQVYGVGTSTTETDMFGNQRTTHRDRYGNTTGTSTTETDMFGNQRTTHRDRYGNSTSSSTSETDMFGNRTTKQNSNNPNQQIWTW